MKYFFVEIVQQDGVHQHTYKAIARGETLKDVQTRMDVEQTYNYDDKKPHENSLVSFYDGETAVSEITVREIPEEYFQVLKQFLSEV